MCLKFLTNVFTELAVHAHNATETQITNGLLKIQNGFYSDIYSSCFRKVDCIWMPRMLGDFSEIPCSLQVIWTLWWHVTNMIEIHRSVTAGSVYARYWSFRTHNFLKLFTLLKWLTLQLLSYILFQESALHIAARNGDLNGVKFLVDGGTDINITDEHGVGTRHWLLRVADVCLRSPGTQANACPLDAKL